MLHQKWKFARIIGMASLLLTGGCSGTTPTAQKAATAALLQLSKYEIEVQRKITGEENYYEQAMRAATERVVDLWDNEQPWQFEQIAKKFASDNLKTPVDTLGLKLVMLMESTKSSWAERDKNYESLLTDTQKTLRNNRKNLEQEMGKITTLRNKLQTLSAARTNQEMLVLTIAFSRQIKKEYDESNESVSGAAPAATTTAGDTQ